ncbi:hypothetical protein EON63_13340 [archaeon]|nr:MAG: hypothetical protein EON63_13340 [archaeon]
MYGMIHITLISCLHTHTGPSVGCEIITPCVRTGCMAASCAGLPARQRLVWVFYNVQDVYVLQNIHTHIHTGAADFGVSKYSTVHMTVVFNTFVLTQVCACVCSIYSPPYTIHHTHHITIR